MYKLKYLFYSFIYTLYSIVYVTLTIVAFKSGFSELYEKFIKNAEWLNFNFLNCIKIGVCLFVYILITTICIYSLYKVVYNLYIFFSLLNGPSIKFDNMKIVIDPENDIITESYMELNDGTKVPIHLQKMVFNNKDSRKETDDE